MRKWRIHLVVFILSIFLGGLLALHVGQDISWDLQNYHFYNPHAFITNQPLTAVAPDSPVTYANPLSDLPSYLLIRHLSPQTAGFLLGMIQGINIWLVFEIAYLVLRKKIDKRRLRAAVAMSVALVSCFGAVTFSEFGGTMTDNLTSIFVLLGVFLLLHSMQSKRRADQLRIAAYISVGVAVGLKLTNSMYMIGLLASGLAIASNWRLRGKQFFINVLAVLAGMLAISGFWYWKLWSAFGSPLFPFYNTVFRSPYYSAVDFVDTRWIPKSVLHVLLEPFYFVSSNSLVAAENVFRDGRLLMALVLLLLVGVVYAVGRWRKWTTIQIPRETVVLGVFFIASYVVWVSKFGYYRYFLVGELVAVVVIAVAVYTLIPKAKLATIVLGVLLCTLLLTTKPLNWGRISWQPTWFGLTEASFVELDGATVFVANQPTASFVIPYFPDSSRTVMIGDGANIIPPRAEALRVRNDGDVQVAIATNSSDTYFLLRGDEAQTQSEIDLNQLGFKTSSCSVLPVYPRTSQPGAPQLRLCRVEPL